MEKSKGVRLSHSASQTYIDCSEKYRLNYVDKIRPNTIPSFFFFGKKVESGLDVLLLRKKKNLTEEELELSKRCPKEVFDQDFKNVEINGDILDPRYTDRVVYFKSDFDASILTDEDEELLLEGMNEGWVSLRRKAHMMIDAYEKEVLPEIEEVFSLQKEIILPNEDGDYIIGYEDFQAKFKDGVTYICDNKTSSKPYKKDSVRLSEQFSPYSEYERNNNCAYIVIEKKIRVREPRVRISIIKDEVQESTKEAVFENFDIVLDGIKNNEYHKNYDSCGFGAIRCPYFNYCRTGDMKGLIDIKNKGKKDGE